MNKVKIILCQETAIGCMRMCAAFCAPLPSPTDPPSPDSLTTDLASLTGHSASWFRMFKMPTHLMVFDESARRRGVNIACHVWGHALPKDSFNAIDEEVLVTSPELTFLQMAAKHSLIEVIRAGFELCGTYSLNPRSDRGFESRSPLTSVNKIGRYLDKVSDVPGIRSARRALGWVLDGSASPRETVMVMLLWLPARLGGYGLDKPLLNPAVDSKGRRVRGSGEARGLLRCDAFWPRAMLDLEYDSDGFHTGADRIAHDSKRRAQLMAAGITVITVTNDQLRNEDSFDEVAGLIADALGKRRRRPNEKAQRARRQLRGMLLGPAEI